MGLTKPGDTSHQTRAHMRCRAAVKGQDESTHDVADDVTQHRVVTPRLIGRLLVHRARTRTHHYSVEADGQSRRHHFRQNATIPTGQGGAQRSFDEQLAQSLRPGRVLAHVTIAAEQGAGQTTLPCNRRRGSTAAWFGAKRPETAQNSCRAGPTDVFGKSSANNDQRGRRRGNRDELRANPHSDAYNSVYLNASTSNASRGPPATGHEPKSSLNVRPNAAAFLITRDPETSFASAPTNLSVPF